MNKKFASFTLYEFPFSHSLNTRWRDLDAFRHVNNATYLSYIEDARINLIKDWGLDYNGKSIIVAAVKINYLKQIAHPNKLIIGQGISRIGNTSFDIFSSVFCKGDDEPAAQSEITIVCFDFSINKSTPIYKQIVEIYNKVSH